jgi:superfamily II DNA or RNA helicase
VPGQPASALTGSYLIRNIASWPPYFKRTIGWLSQLTTLIAFSFSRMPFSLETTPSAAARKQALQDQVLAIIQGRRLAGIALTMGLGKTLIGLRDMAHLLAEGQLLDQSSGKLFLVAAPTQAILDS